MSRNIWKNYLVYLSVIACATIPLVSDAATYTWQNSGADLNDSTNWGGTTPVAGDQGDFTGGGNASPTLAASMTVGTFNFTGGTYNLSSNSGGILTFSSSPSGSGVINTSGNTQTFTASGGQIHFDGTSARDASSTAPVSYNLTSSGGSIAFNNASTAGTANFDFQNTSTGILFQPSADMSVDGAITGTGGTTAVIVNMISNTLTLNNASNTYTGTTRITSGTLKAGAFDTFPKNSDVLMSGTSKLDTDSYNNTIGSLEGAAGNTVFLRGAMLTLSNSTNTTYAGAITGSPGSLTKSSTSTGTTTLSGSNLNTYTGNTTLQGGTFQAGAANAFAPDSAVVMSNSAILDLNSNNNTIASLTGAAGNSVTLGSGTLSLKGTASTSYAGAITGTGGVTKLATSTGTTTLSGSGLNTYSGDTTINAGSVKAGANSAFSPNSNVVLVTGATLDTDGFTNTIGALSGTGGNVNVGSGSFTFGNATSTSYSGTFSGSGAMSTQGSGTFNYTGSSLGYSGTTAIGNALFALNGALGGNVNVNSGSTLSGNGTVGGDLTINSGATISPGNSIGIQTVLGNYTQDVNSTYIVEVNNLGQSDLIDVTGTATLLGGTVNVVTLGSYLINHKYLIVDADGGVNGTFQGATAASISGFISPLLSYTPNQVFLELQTQIINAACSHNTAEVAIQLDNIENPSDELMKILSTISALDAAAACTALNEMTGQQHTLSLMMAENNGRQFLRRLYDPLRPLVTTLPCCYTCWVDSCCTAFSPWFEAGGGRTIIDGNHNTKGLKLNELEVSGGVQGTREDFTVGIAGSYVQDQIDYNVGGTGKSRTGYGALYGLYRPCGWYVLGDIAYGYTQNTVRRPIHIDTLFYKARGKANINQVIGYIEGGFDLYCKCLLIQPFLGFEGGYYHMKHIDESGGYPLNLYIQGKKLSNAYSRCGVHLTMDRMTSHNISVSLDVAWAYRLSKNPHNNLTERFDTFGDAFTIYGIDNGRNSVDGAITITGDICDKWQVYAEAVGTYWGKNSTYNFLGGVQYSW